MSLSDRSEAMLAGVHPDLVAVVQLAAQGLVPFVVTEGLRSLERQTALVAAGKSRTMNSLHLSGRAVDLAYMLPDGTISWVRDDYKRLAVEMKMCAVELAIPIEWGGDWQWFDGCHFQLSPKFYLGPTPNLEPEGQVTPA